MTLYHQNPADNGPVELADLVSRQAHGRIEKQFRHLFVNSDKFFYEIAQKVLADEYIWLENDIIKS